MTRITWDQPDGRLLLQVEDIKDSPEEVAVQLRTLCRMLENALHRARASFQHAALDFDGDSMLVDLVPFKGEYRQVESILQTSLEGFSCLSELYPEDVEVDL